MEGVSHEAASLAGHLRLGKLIYFYDDNSITIEGETSLAFSDDVQKRFEGYGWHVQRINGQDRAEIATALDAARRETERPSIIAARTTIAFGSPNKAGTHDAHGAPLGADEVKATREKLGWKHEPFVIPEEARAVFLAAGEAGAAENVEWDRLFAEYSRRHPEKAAEWKRIHERRLPERWEEKLPRFSSKDKPIATRAASGKVINAIARTIPELIGGSADLAPSNNTLVNGEASVSRDDFGGRNIHFGVREHGMAATMNGMCLHGGIRPYGGTFLVFSDYMRPSVRLAALMEQPVVFVYTHDSVFLGEDGPTHQPIEHIASLRAMPNLRVMRPADANETAAAWRVALEHTRGPTALLLTRQGLPIFDESVWGNGPEKGAYVLDREPGKQPDVILLASGSEVSVVREAGRMLRDGGIGARVVSMLCWELFEEQPEEYRRSVLPPGVTRRLAVEAASPFGWERWVGPEGRVVAIDRFGASAPYKVIAEKLGFTPENVAREARSLLSR